MFQSSSSKEKSLIKDFKSITGSTDKVAQDTLKSAGWKLDAAVDMFYSRGGAGSAAAAPAKKGDDKKISKIFDEYVDAEHKDDLFDDGLARFLKDIGISSSNMESLGLSWRLNCKEQGLITRKEFVEGFVNMGSDSIQKMKADADQLKKDLQSPAQFKQFYTWLFNYCTESKRKTIDKPMAVGVWGLVLASWPLIQAWCDFCNEVDEKHLKAVSKDLWLQVYEFSRDVSPDLKNYDADSGAWPVLLDMFVEQLREKRQSS